MVKRLWKLFSAYVANYLACAAQGHLGHFGIGKESAWGTAVAVTDYAEIMSENLVLGIDRFETRNVFAGWYEPDDYAGVRRSTGGVIMAGFPTPIGHLFRGAFNNVSQTVVLSGFLVELSIL